MRFLRPFLSLVVVALLASPLGAAPDYWKKDIQKFLTADAANPPPQDAVLFIGSSSIRMWKTLAKDFPQVKTINRGFGGSELADSVYYADQIAIPYRPRIVVLYAGDNDVANNKSPEQIAADFVAFREKIHAALPQTRIIYLAVKLSPSRMQFRDAALRTNELIAADCAQHPLCTFVDIVTPMLDDAGQPRPELFLSDMLHLSDAGYAIWTRALAPHLQP